MEQIGSYTFLIAISLIIIISFIFNEVSKKTNIPSVLMLVVLGIVIKYFILGEGFDSTKLTPILKILGTVGLIMIVLEAALELELRREKLVPIMQALFIALVGLMLSAWVGALLLQYFIPEMNTLASWIYSTPLAILSSAIIIPSVNTLRGDKKEFHIYESTFSDILGIMLFFFLVEDVLISSDGLSASSFVAFSGNTLLTIVISFVASYFMLIIFQKIKSHVKLFLLISVLLLLYALAKKMHLSSLLIILVFGVMIANMEVFFRGPFKKYLNLSISKSIFDGLHVITQETAFVVRTLFFVVFGLTIVLGSLADMTVVMISLFILLSIYIIRYALIRGVVGKDISPQLYIAPRGLITIILFYEIPEITKVSDFSEGILLFIIIATSIIMTIALIFDKKRSQSAIAQAKRQNVGYSLHEIQDPKREDNPSAIY